MHEKIDLLLGVIVISAIAVGGFTLILITRMWFWVAVIAITLITNT